MSIGRKWKEMIDVTDKISYSVHVSLSCCFRLSICCGELLILFLTPLLQEDSKKDRSAKPRYSVWSFSQLFSGMGQNSLHYQVTPSQFFCSSLIYWETLEDTSHNFSFWSYNVISFCSLCYTVLTFVCNAFMIYVDWQSDYLNVRVAISRYYRCMNIVILCRRWAVQYMHSLMSLFSDWFDAILTSELTCICLTLLNSHYGEWNWLLILFSIASGTEWKE